MKNVCTGVTFFVRRAWRWHKNQRKSQCCRRHIFWRPWHRITNSFISPAAAISDRCDDTVSTAERRRRQPSSTVIGCFAPLCLVQPRGGGAGSDGQSLPRLVIASASAFVILFLLFDFAWIVVTRFPFHHSRPIAFLATDDNAWCRRDSNMIWQKTKKLVYTSVWSTRLFCILAVKMKPVSKLSGRFLCTSFHSLQKSFFYFKYGGDRCNIQKLRVHDQSTWSYRSFQWLWLPCNNRLRRQQHVFSNVRTSTVWGPATSNYDEVTIQMLPLARGRKRQRSLVCYPKCLYPKLLARVTYLVHSHWNQRVNETKAIFLFFPKNSLFPVVYFHLMNWL